MDERAPALTPQRFHALERLQMIGRLLVDGGAVSPRRRDLERARVAPGDEQAVDPLARAAPGQRLGVVAGRDGDDAALLLIGRERRQLREDPARLERPGLLEQLRLEESAPAEGRAERLRREERRAVEAAANDRGRGVYIRLYSGPSPPSGGVSRPPFAEMAPHWMQFEAVTSTPTTFPAGLASPETSYTWAGQRCSHVSATSRRTLRSTRMWLGASSRVLFPERKTLESLLKKSFPSG